MFPLLNHMQKVRCRRFGFEIVCPNMRVLKIIATADLLFDHF